jgi:thioredoxin 1
MMELQAIRCARLFVCALMLGAAGCETIPAGDPRPYDGKADPKAAIAQALAENPQRKPVLLTFGANWCSDSRALERHYRSQPLAGTLEQEFRVVHVDVGRFHRNSDVVERYGNPTDKGIPSVVLLDAEGNTLFVNHGALSSAGSMTGEQVRVFFERLVEQGRQGRSGAEASH